MEFTYRRNTRVQKQEELMENNMETIYRRDTRRTKRRNNLNSFV